MRRNEKGLRMKQTKEKKREEGEQRIHEHSKPIYLQYDFLFFVNVLSIALIFLLLLLLFYLMLSWCALCALFFCYNEHFVSNLSIFFAPTRLFSVA